MMRLTSFWSLSMSNPSMVADPEVLASKVVRILMVVLLPAPLGPRKPNISPFCTWNEMPSTATKSGANTFLSSLTSIIASDIGIPDSDLLMTSCQPSVFQPLFILGVGLLRRHAKYMGAMCELPFPISARTGGEQEAYPRSIFAIPRG